MARRLHPDEAALWARVRATVRPIPGRAATALTDQPVGGAPGRLPLPAPPRAPLPSFPQSAPGHTLDRGWDKRLAGGAVLPERTIDLHGHTLASAHAALETGLEQALRRGERVILLVTGKPPRADSHRPHARGAIRAHVEDWLRLSRHAGGIAAVRGAHPRHGGAGALYVILRRPRTAKS